MPGALDPGHSTDYKAVGEDLVSSSSKLVLDTLPPVEVTGGVPKLVPEVHYEVAAS